MKERKQLFRKGNRRLLSLVLALAVMLTSFSFAPIKAEAADAVVASGYCGYGDNLRNARWEVKGDTLYITGTGKIDGTAMQPNQDTLNVRWKKWELFNDEIKTIEIDEGIKCIGIGSFANMTNLKTVKLPKSLEIIEGCAFLKDASIEKVIIPIGSQLKAIYDEIFAYNRLTYKEIWGAALLNAEKLEYCMMINDGCIPEKYLTKENGLTYFGKILLGIYAGYEDTSVVIKEGTLGIGNDVFSQNDYITEVVLPSSIKAISRGAFSNCPNLETVSANGAKLDYVGAGAFGSSHWANNQNENDYVQLNNALIESNIRQTVSVGSDIDIIADGAFSACSTLETVSFASDSKIRSIPNGLFADCRSLQSITLPQTIETIGENAFYNCVALQSINIPDSVKTIQRSAFEKCKNLGNVTGGNNVTVCEQNAFKSTPYGELQNGNNLVKLGKCLITATYKNPEGGKVTLPSDCCCISGEVKCFNVTEFVIPESYTQCYSSCLYFDTDDTSLPKNERAKVNMTVPCSLSVLLYDINLGEMNPVFDVHCVKDSAIDNYLQIAKKNWQAIDFPYDCDISYDLSHATEPVKKNFVEATCTQDGSYDEIISCKYCGFVKSSEHHTIKATGHKEVKDFKAATTKKDGKLTVTCSKCKETLKEEVIPRAYVTVEDTAKYTGKTVKQPVKVTDKNGKTISKDNYSISYKNNKKVGKATVTVKFKGNYSGTSKNTFVITKKADIPSAVKSLKLKAAKKAITVSWKPLTKKCTGYEIQYSTDKKFLSSDTKVKKITKAATKTLKLSKLSSGKKYYVRMRATAKDSKKNTVHSDWSKAVSVKVK